MYESLIESIKNETDISTLNSMYKEILEKVEVISHGENSDKTVKIYPKIHRLQ